MINHLTALIFTK